ncbi:diphosphomevalonate decarboxylase [Gardnerella vaginalis]|uniref:diphosphomevalonate decarboxylase n=1 Tax=Gardnerella vaginalis TaxID=2702 RepID=A0A133NZR3_GARVA|nr:diphosphomevalonate decarboxylase [Gardnerella vaginalis]KXA21776.1 diphosphomevalonate decarboxylase [Gardnerella vaginalis]
MKNVEIQPKITFDSSISPHSAVARANVNIALIKYWGKRNERLILPYTSSLSLTLSDLYATTSVCFDDHLVSDRVTLDSLQLPVDNSTYLRVVAMLDLVREMAGISAKASVVSQNHVPIAAGLASSASGSAALAAAASYAAGLKLTSRELSRLARRGSGSACRSIFGGFVIWNAGEDDESSYAEPVIAAENLNPAMIVVTLDDSKKPVSSRTAMRRTVETSPAYMPWVERSKEDFLHALAAVRDGDIEQLGEIMEQNSLGMHETMHQAVPPVNYLTDKTHAVLNVVKSMRKCGWPVWATMDAGPNVKVLTVVDCANRVENELRGRVENELRIMSEGTCAYSRGDLKFTVALPGDGVTIRTCIKTGMK